MAHGVLLSCPTRPQNGSSATRGIVGSMAVTNRPATAAAMREAERITMLHTPEDTLMDRAATAIAAECGGLSPVVLLVGAGNNGGDALLAGALLASQGANVTAVLLTPDAHPRGLAMLTQAGGRVLEWQLSPEGARSALRAAAAVIDGIVGLGGRPGLRPDAQEAVAAIAERAQVIAVDLGRPLLESLINATSRRTGHRRGQSCLRFIGCQRPWSPALASLRSSCGGSAH